jgi:hypothetical protein
MPLGVTQKGFTRYTGSPFCHGCAESLDTQCCDIVNPDYAYSYDYLDASSASGLVERFLPDTDNIHSQSPTFELNDLDFQNNYLQHVGDQFVAPLKVVKQEPKNKNALFINESCKTLLNITGLDKLGYTFVFGKCDEYSDGRGGCTYFVATVCIHAPSKQKGKVISYECLLCETSCLFARVKTIGSISEDQLTI